MSTMTTSLPTLTAKDLASDQEVRWCPGCGDYSILAQMKKALAAARHSAREDGVHLRHRLLQPLPLLHEHLRLPHHPRPGADLRHRPEGWPGPTCSVWVITGDGDGLSIGGNHLIHAIRRNVDLKIILFNNEIYGLTKGQYSPTSRIGHADQVEPAGLDRQPAAAAVAGHRRRGDVRGPHHRRGHQPPDRDAAAGGGPQGHGVRRDLPELQDLQRRRLRVRHRQEHQGRQHRSTWSTASR